MSLLMVHNLRTYLHTNTGVVQAVEGVSFNINEGETFCLVGESGSGKSITALSLMRLFPDGLVSHPSGEIWLSGTGLAIDKTKSTAERLAIKRRSYARRAVSYRYGDQEEVVMKPEDSINILSLPAARLRQIRGSQMAMIFQEPMTSLNPVLNIGEQIMESLLLHNPSMAVDEAQDRAIKALEQVQLSQAKQRLLNYPHQLSGGQRQRVMIAMALACEPRLLIADEPTTALDVTVQAEILRLMRQLQDDMGMGMLFITHDFGVVAEIAHQVGVMQQGRLVEVGETKQLLQHPQHAYSKQLLAAVPENLARQRNRHQAMSETAKADISSLSTSSAPPTLKLFEFETLLEVKNLKVWFPIRKGILRRTVDYVRAVNNVNLRITRGSITALVGESGCGKTTLGRAILQLVPPTAGSVIMAGQNLVELNRQQLRLYRAKMQVVFQDPQSSLNPRLLVETMLTEPMKVHGIGQSYEERLEKAAQVLEQVQLKREFLWRYPHEFSGGQRQRIGLARALVLQPEFIVCDEITSALDVSVQAEILQLLLDIREKQGLTLLFITHNIGVVEYLSDQTVVMYKGKIVEQGKTTQVCGHPEHEYTQQLLAAVPRLILRAA